MTKNEKAVIRVRAWRQKNPERARANEQKRDKAKKAAYDKIYNSLNKAKRAKRHRDNYLVKTYRITPDTYDKMVKAQNGLCKICERPPTNTRYKYLHVDHDHKTGKVRGLLCHTCNIGLGSFADNTTWLRKAANYVEGFLE